MEIEVIELELPIHKLFDLYILGSGIKYKWIASNIGISASHLSKMCKGEKRLTEKMRQKMNELLETNY